MFVIYRADFLLEWGMFQTNAVQNIEIHFILNNLFSNIVPSVI
jgi:hypothetical protein